MIEEGWAQGTGLKPKWLKLPEIGGLEIQFIEGNFVNYWGHYVNKHMRICTGSGCKFCELGIGKARRYVFDVVLTVSKEQFLFEVSETIAERIKAHAMHNEDLSGRVFFVKRLSGSKYSNMQIYEDLGLRAIDDQTYTKQDIKYILEQQELYFQSKNDVKEHISSKKKSYALPELS